MPIDEFGLGDALERPELEDYDVYEDAPEEGAEIEDQTALDQLEQDWEEDTDEADRIRASIGPPLTGSPPLPHAPGTLATPPPTNCPGSAAGVYTVAVKSGR